MSEMLSARELAAELKCSRRHASDLMQEMNPFAIGARRLRVTREDFETWVDRQKESRKTASSSVASSGGAVLGGRGYRRNAGTVKRPASPELDSSESMQIRITQPKGKRRSA